MVDVELLAELLDESFCLDSASSELDDVELSDFVVVLESESLVDLTGGFPFPFDK